MTFSIVALSPDGHYLGVATATRTLAVGAVVPAAAPRAGALATQAYTNRTFRSRVLELLRQDVAPAEVLEVLRGEDAEFDHRQLGVVDDAGRSATWTGPGCSAWAGGRHGPRYAVVGNLLTGPEVLDAMESTYLGAATPSFPQLLVDALRAGESAGGDRRGRQSAALYVVANEAADIAPPVAVVDLRVDDHPAPVAELGRLLGIWHAEVETEEERRGRPVVPEARTVGELRW
ncbi:DUF1028 domain-containing protein [Georgenia muralis]